jgi:4-aminobutyrate aminotransferase/(S)-3-amino-2-methylpropionate transaminase
MKKTFEILLDRVNMSNDISEKNKEALNDFLIHEHPGDILFTKWTEPPIIERAKGSRLWDMDGKEYIDCLSGMSCMNLGHGDKRIIDAMTEQYAKLDHWFDFPTPERLKLINRLIKISPGSFKKRVRLALSGSDAVELAIRSARSYTKKTHIIAFYGAYHGQNTATIGLTGAGSMHQWYNPVPPADHCIRHFPYAYCYRCAYNMEYPSCDMHCVKAIDNLMSSTQTCFGNPYAGVNNVAAMIVEPMQSSSGYIVPPKEYLVRLRELADKYGFLLIFDEIQAGMGRTGKMFACEHSGISPDIMLIGKALGNGVPMSAMIGRAEIFEDIAPGYVVSAYAGYSFGCAVANKVLDIFEDDDVVAKCAKTGEYLLKVLNEHKRKHPVVGSYSAIGLYFGIEYVRDQETKEPASKETMELIDKMCKAGLLAQINGYHNNRISFIPPINITEQDIDEIFAIMDRLTKEIEVKYKID